MVCTIASANAALELKQHASAFYLRFYLGGFPFHDAQQLQAWRARPRTVRCGRLDSAPGTTEVQSYRSTAMAPLLHTTVKSHSGAGTMYHYAANN